MGYNVTKIGLMKSSLETPIGHQFFSYKYLGDVEQTIASWIELPHQWGLKIWVDFVIQKLAGTNPFVLNLRRNGVLQVQASSVGVAAYMKEFRVVGLTGAAETWTLSIQGADATTRGSAEGGAYCTFS